MARERWLVDGWELTEGGVRDVSTRAGLYGTPELRGAGVVPVSGRPVGGLWRRQLIGAGAFRLQLWLGEGSRALLEPRYDELVRRTIAVQHRLPLWTRYLADGTVRECNGYVADALEPDSSRLGQAGLELQLVVTVPAGSWRDTADAWLADQADVLGDTVVLAAAARGTAPLDAEVYVVTGPATDVRLTDPATGEWVQLEGILAAGEEWQVHAASWASRVAAAGAALSPAAGVDATARTAYTGGRLLTVVPDQTAGGYRVTVTGSNGSAATRLRVSGRVRYAA